MTRKRFIKLLMGQRVPRDICTEVAQLVAATGAPYSAVKIVFMRPFFDEFYIQIIFEKVALLDPQGFMDSMDQIRALLKKACHELSDLERLYFQLKPEHQRCLERWVSLERWARS